MLDIGSVGNVVGDELVRQQAAAAMRAGLTPEQRRRERPLTVTGVGKGGEKWTRNCSHLVTLLKSAGQPFTGTHDTPAAPNSQLPALRVLTAAQDSRMIIATERSTVCMVGLCDYGLMRALPSRAQQSDNVLALSGHLVLPCAEF